MNLEKAQSIYQELISNSFWKEYDMKYFMKISKLFYDLQQELSVQYPWNSEVRKRNRVVVFFNAMCHDFNLMMNNLYYSTIEKVSECHKMSENKKTVMQSWLRILKCLAFEEKISSDDNIAYLINYSQYSDDYDNKHDRLKILTTVENDDGTYRAVQVVKEYVREKLITYFNKRIERYSKEAVFVKYMEYIKYIRQAYTDEVERLKKGDKITKYFMLN